MAAGPAGLSTCLLTQFLVCTVCSLQDARTKLNSMQGIQERLAASEAALQAKLAASEAAHAVAVAAQEEARAHIASLQAENAQLTHRQAAMNVVAICCSGGHGRMFAEQ